MVFESFASASRRAFESYVEHMKTCTVHDHSQGLAMVTQHPNESLEMFRAGIWCREHFIKPAGKG